MAYAFVQQNASDNATSASTITVTLTPTAGNLLVFGITGDSADTTSIALSDNLGSHNTFTQIGTDLVTGTAQRCAWWFAANCKGGATTFTATFSAGTRFRGIYVAEYSGIATSSPLLNGTRAQSANPGTGTDAISSGTANATSQPALAWGFSIDTDGSAAPTAGTGFTSRTSVWSSATCFGRPEDKRVTATGNVAATLTAVTGTDTYATGIGLFSEAATTVSGTGSAAGTSTVTGVSPSSSGSGSAAGVATASGSGASIATGVGSSAGTGAASGVALSTGVFPLTVSSDGRYLKSNDGTPFLLCADTTWSLFVDIPLSGVSSYFSTLVSQGFNAVSGNAIEHHYTTVKPPKERSGLLPFTQRMDGTTYTGSPNGTTSSAGTQGQFASDNYGSPSSQSPDCTFINNSYWLAVEQILDAALANNLAVLVWPGYLGFHANDEGWMNEMVVWDSVTGAGGFTGQSFANPAKSKMWNYGAWMAARWKNYPNIIWVMGGDYGSNTQTLSTAQASAVSNLMAGLKSVSGQQSTLFTAHWDRPAISTDTSLAAGSFDLNGCYADEAVAELARRAYAVTPAKPAIGLEYFYELDLFGGSTPFRKYVYWQFLGGVAGGFYGHEQLWRFDDGTPGTDYTTLLSTTARLDAVRQFAFWRSKPWHRLRPNGLNSIGTLITAGGGTASPQSTDYVAAAATPEGDLLLAYLPPAHTGSVTVDMTKLSATVQARWFDPANATYTTIGAFANTGTHAFTTTGNNSAGDADWLLVLETPSAASAGTSTVSGVGSSIATGAGSSAGTGAATGAGVSLATAAGSAAGTSTAPAASGSVLTGVGSSAGAGTASGVGSALSAGAGASSGTATASAVGVALANGAGTSSGVGAAVGVGMAIAATAGSVAGTCTTTAVGAALASATGVSAGVSTVSGAGASTTAGTGIGASTGTSTDVGVGVSLVAAVGSAAGTSTAGAASAISYVGSAAGSSTCTGFGVSLWSAVGSAAGHATVAGFGLTGGSSNVHIPGTSPDPEVYSGTTQSEVYDYTGTPPPPEFYGSS